ncbi:hypothetical protein [Streptomyces sp. NPDC001744]|uniref:hypothetical protein n=1 Tax=Streptomyces sp. NPDC001744 TaxID=3364606 RepID=UPI00368C68DF
MPDHTSVARLRAGYTGERLATAKAGISRKGSIGIDECRPEQLPFRALFALGYLSNDPHEYEGPTGWQTAVLSAYTVTFSPRWDRLVIITKVPDNVTSRLLPGPAGRSGLPGLRLVEHCGFSSYVLRHLPTGAEFVVTRNLSGKSAGTPSLPSIDGLTTAAPITKAEQEQLRRTPDMTEDAQRLLAGLLARTTTRDPGRSWAIGNWFYDPLKWPGWPDRNHRGRRRLRGRGDHWVLSWDSFPYESDLVTAMTDPVIGVAEAQWGRDDGDTVITLGNATLRLRPGWDS